jgi:hypothetical protein
MPIKANSARTIETLRSIELIFILTFWVSSIQPTVRSPLKADRLQILKGSFPTLGFRMLMRGKPVAEEFFNDLETVLTDAQ